MKRLMIALTLINVSLMMVPSAMALNYQPVDMSMHINGPTWHTWWPRGDVILGGIPFSIPNRPPGENIMWNGDYAANHGGGMVSIDIPVGIFNVSEVHTLINTLWGRRGPHCYAWLEFFGSKGAYFRKNLLGNDDIRDSLNSIYTNYINGTTTIEVVTYPPYRLDKQLITLPADFSDESLLTIRVTDNGGRDFQRLLLTGVTVGYTPTVVPLPSTFILSGGGLCLLAIYRESSGISLASMFG